MCSESSVPQYIYYVILKVSARYIYNIFYGVPVYLPYNLYKITINRTVEQPAAPDPQAQILESPVYGDF